MDMKGMDFLNKQDAVLCLIQALHKLFVFFWVPLIYHHILFQ